MSCALTMQSDGRMQATNRPPVLFGGKKNTQETQCRYMALACMRCRNISAGPSSRLVAMLAAQAAATSTLADKQLLTSPGAPDSASAPVRRWRSMCELGRDLVATALRMHRPWLSAIYLWATFFTPSIQPHAVGLYFLGFQTARGALQGQPAGHPHRVSMRWMW